VIGPDRHIGFFSVNGSYELKPGAFGILEPTDGATEIPISKLDMILVPGIVFDREGYRIGYGHGYYDRILNGAQAKCVGLAYSFQVISHVPHDASDARMDVIITDKGHIKK